MHYPPIAPVEEIRAATYDAEYRAGWEQSFGRSIGAEAEWLLQRDTQLFGIRSTYNRLVAGMGVRTASVSVGKKSFRIGIVHDCWVLPEFRRQRRFTALAEFATGLVESGAIEAVAAFPYTRGRPAATAGFVRAGYRAFGRLDVLVGSARSLTPHAGLALVHGSKVSEFGYTQVEDCFVESQDGCVDPSLVRDAAYLAGRFDASPRPYLVAGVTAAQSRNLIALAIAKVHPPKQRLQVLLLAARTLELRQLLLSSFVRDLYTRTGYEQLDITLDLAADLRPWLVSKRFEVEDEGHEFLVWTPNPLLFGRWRICRDESTAF